MCWRSMLVWRAPVASLHTIEHNYAGTPPPQVRHAMSIVCCCICMFVCLIFPLPVIFIGAAGGGGGASEVAGDARSNFGRRSNMNSGASGGVHQQSVANFFDPYAASQPVQLFPAF